MIGALVVSLAGFAPPRIAGAQVQLPALGESAAEDFTVGTERRLGEQIMGDIRRDPDYFDDPILQEYLNSIWRPLVAAAQQRGDIGSDIGSQFSWEAFLVRDRSINAFALPGGFVGVHLGLIAMTSSRDELASVLAHELSHVTQRHIARSMASSQKASLVGLGALILGILAASRTNNADMAQAAIVGGQAAAQQGQLNFSRDMEREADRIGFGVLEEAGFEGRGMASMFEKLDLANRLNDNGSFPYLRSHPLTVERMSEARSRLMLGMGAGQQAPWLHTLMQARARVFMDGSADWLRRQSETTTLKPNSSTWDRLGALYSGSLAAGLLHQGSKATGLLVAGRQVAREVSERPVEVDQALELLDVELRLLANDSVGASQILGRAIDGGPESRAVMLLRSQAALNLHRDKQAGATEALKRSLESLQAWVSVHPHDAVVWSSLAVSADALGLALRSLRAQAENRAALGDITGAIDRLRAGRLLSRGSSGQDFIEASIIDARLRDLEGRRRQLAADARGARGGRDGEGRPGP